MQLLGLFETRKLFDDYLMIVCDYLMRISIDYLMIIRNYLMLII